MKIRRMSALGILCGVVSISFSAEYKQDDVCHFRTNLKSLHILVKAPEKTVILENKKDLATLAATIKAKHPLSFDDIGFSKSFLRNQDNIHRLNAMFTSVKLGVDLPTLRYVKNTGASAGEWTKEDKQKLRLVMEVALKAKRPYRLTSDVPQPIFCDEYLHLITYRH